MQKYSWDELPESVRSATQKHVGLIERADSALAGQGCNAALTLCRSEADPVFLKAVNGVSPEMRWLRNEAEAGSLATDVAPAVLFHEDVDDWLVVGFEYVSGRSANLAPGSPDLATVASVLNRISEVEAPGLRPLQARWQSSWWTRLAGERPDAVGPWDVDELTKWERKAAEAVKGNHLVHTDLHEDQFVLGDDGAVHVIDWGWPACGAAWLDSAFLVLRLIGAGHRPEDAEKWAAANTPWAAATEDEVTAFAVYVAGLWHYKATSHKLTRLARTYAGWRLRLLD